MKVRGLHMGASVKDDIGTVDSIENPTEKLEHETEPWVMKCLFLLRLTRVLVVAIFSLLLIKIDGILAAASARKLNESYPLEDRPPSRPRP